MTDIEYLVTDNRLLGIRKRIRFKLLFFYFCIYNTFTMFHAKSTVATVLFHANRNCIELYCRLLLLFFFFTNGQVFGLIWNRSKYKWYLLFSHLYPITYLPVRIMVIFLILLVGIVKYWINGMIYPRWMIHEDNCALCVLDPE